MGVIPKDRNLDSTASLLKEGYLFISNRCRQYGSDLFETRLMLKKFICMRGQDAAAVFYGTDLFSRRNAMPRRVRETLTGDGVVQLLDGERHRSRKKMFLSLMDTPRINRLAELTGEEWNRRLHLWEQQTSVVLYPEVQQILCRAVCRWAGVPLREQEAGQRTRDFSLMIDTPAAIGWHHIRGRLARNRAEKWIADAIDRVRSKRLWALPGSAITVIAAHRDPDGSPLARETAAAELINVLRPTVAVARFVIFGATALHEHPEWRERIARGDREALDRFVQEVRRFYPLFPFAGARVREGFTWKGYRFPEGRNVLLDLYGTDHDERIWGDPDVFRPERFSEWNGSAFSFIPQGGGDHAGNHRCPGEWITIELMKTSLRFLCRSMNYEVPAQDLAIDLSRMPTLPQSRFVVRNISRTGLEQMPKAA